MNNINNSNSTVSEQSKSRRVYTKLKFIRSEVSGSPVSFVSQNPTTGRICGVRQDSKYPKKICIVDKALVGQVMLNALYDCTLIPMTNKKGYVVVEIVPVQFTAKISTTYIKGNAYFVEVKFGNKTIKFDPFNGKKESVKNFKACKEVLEKRIDVKNIVQVVEDFERAANTLVMLMEKDTYSRRKL